MDLRDELGILREAQNAIAHSIAKSALKYEDYLIQVGRYRELANQLERLIKQRRAEIGAEEGVGGIGDREFDDIQPRRQPARRIQARPRTWGGGR